MSRKRRRKSSGQPGRAGGPREQGPRPAAAAPEPSVRVAERPDAGRAEMPAAASESGPQPAALAHRPAGRAPEGVDVVPGRAAPASYGRGRDAVAATAAAGLLQSLRGRVRERPIQSVLAAAGVGVLIGLTWR